MRQTHGNRKRNRRFAMEGLEERRLLSFQNGLYPLITIPQTAVAAVGQALPISIHLNSAEAAAAHIDLSPADHSTSVHLADISIDGYEATTTAVLPADLTPGTYNIQVTFDPISGIAPGELGYGGSDNFQVVAASESAPDLTIGRDPFYGIGWPVFANTGGQIEFSVSNQGTVDAGAFDVSIYLSPTATLGADRTLLGSTTVPGLAALTQTSGLPLNFKVPVDAETGTAYVFMVYDDGNQISEGDEGNNVLAATGGPAVVEQLPDAAITSLIAPARALQGGYAIATPTVVTTSDWGASPPEIRYYLSTDAALDENDLLLENISTSSSGVVSIPSTVAPGSYFMIATVAASDGFPDGDTTDDVAVSGAVEIVSAPAVTPSGAGSIDGIFANGSGISLTEAQPYGFKLTVATQLPDGSILGAGTFITSANGPISYFALARFKPDGTLDTTFGQNGFAQFDDSGDEDAVRKLYVQPDGKIIVAGLEEYIEDALVSGTGNLPNIDWGSPYIARFNADGSRDMSYGTGGHTELGFPSKTDNYPLDFQLMGDGSMLVLAVQGLLSQTVDLIHYGPDGTLDASFGTGGKIVLDGLPTAGTGNSWASTTGVLAVDGSAYIETAVTSNGGADSASYLKHYNADGSVDPEFNGGATLTLPGPGHVQSLLIMPDGSVLADYQAGYIAGMALVHITAAGTIDTAFGLGGYDIPLRPSFSPTAIGVGPDGGIYVAGGFSLARLNSDGTLDRSFGIGGVTESPLDSSYTTTSANSILFTDDTHLILVGSAKSGWTKGTLVAMDLSPASTVEDPPVTPDPPTPTSPTPPVVEPPVLQPPVLQPPLEEPPVVIVPIETPPITTPPDAVTPQVTMTITSATAVLAGSKQKAALTIRPIAVVHPLLLSRRMEYSVEIFLSEDAVFSQDDAAVSPLKKLVVNLGRPGKAMNFSQKFIIPKSTAAGDDFLFARLSGADGSVVLSNTPIRITSPSASLHATAVRMAKAHGGKQKMTKFLVTIRNDEMTPINALGTVSLFANDPGDSTAAIKSVKRRLNVQNGKPIKLVLSVPAAKIPAEAVSYRATIQ